MNDQQKLDAITSMAYDYVNSYRAQFGKSAVSRNETLETFAQAGADSAAAAGIGNGDHSHFQNADSATKSALSNEDVALSGEVAAPSGTFVVKSIVFSSETNTKDTISSIPETLNELTTENDLREMAMSVIYQFGNDNQPAGYAGTNELTQGSAHKQNILKDSNNTVGIGLAKTDAGMVIAYVDFGRSLSAMLFD
jgi:hypothetical protein